MQRYIIYAMWPARPPLASVGNVSPVEGISFEPKEKRLRYMGHILNLIAKAYLFG